MIPFSYAYIMQPDDSVKLFKLSGVSKEGRWNGKFNPIEECESSVDSELENDKTFTRGSA